MERDKKKILLVSYHFPPSRAIGGRRIAAFARYLQDFGWQPFVVTIKDSRILEKRDQDGLRNLHCVEIHKAGMLPSLRDMYLKIKGSVKNAGGRGGRGEAAAGADPASRPPSMGRRLKRFIASVTFLPDENRNWIIPATLKALRLIRREKIDCILTSCPPYSAHVVGLLIKLINPKIMWIADFRDPWMVPGEKVIYPTTAFSNFFDYNLEKNVITKSDLVLTTTRNLAEKLSLYYRGVDPGKFKLIANGFEPDDLPSCQKEKYQIFTISYTGSLYFGRTPEPLFLAVASLIQDNLLLPGDIRIKLVGHCHTINNVSTTEVARKYRLEDVVEVIESVPQTESLEIIQRSHIALLLAPGQPYQIPGKTYEYIGIGTPILTFTEEGATADLINSITAGKAVHPESIGEMKDFVLATLQQRHDPALQKKTVTEQFTRHKTVELLAQYLTAIHSKQMC